MKPVVDSQTTIPRREPATVMRLERLGSLHQSRLSFMRILTRRMKREAWTFSCPVFDIDNSGVGHAVYSARGPKRTYSLIAFSHDLPAEKRSDRVIAEAWDATFTLFDGVPDKTDIQRLSKNIPLQEAGRVTQSELSVSRANRSVRLWEHVVSSLASGKQPDPERINAVGYLMRTTAVYGSGKLGASDHEDLIDRAEFSAPFQVEMLSVFLTRGFVRDLVQSMARNRGGDQTVTLDATIARSMGIGNSTGLGMAPFLLNHAILFNNWIMAREEAISRVRSVEFADADDVALFRHLLSRSVTSAELWHSEHPIQIKKLNKLRDDLDSLVAHCNAIDLASKFAWDKLYLWSESTLSIEGQECVASLILEPYPDLVDGLASCMSDRDNRHFRIDGSMSVGQLMHSIESEYAWALALDWTSPENVARAWYVSEEKLEPRLGERFQEPIEPYEQALAPARDIVALYEGLKAQEADQSLAQFLLVHPQHRHAVRRVQILGFAPYAEIRDNTISSSLLPIDMLRCKLAFFGAIHFDPRSDRWVRICMYGNAPYPEELMQSDADFWPYPDTMMAKL